MSRITHKFVAILALVLGASVFASQYPAAAAHSAQNDTNLQAEVTNKALNKTDLKGVQATAHDGAVTLTGTVKLFGHKEEADKRTHKIKGVRAVSDEIRVARPELPDHVLGAKLSKAITYDRVGYGTTPFNAIAALSGHLADAGLGSYRGHLPAYARIYQSLQEQAASLAYVDTFKVLAVGR
jgi:hyperosmotically inducible periplasmic protein